MGPSAVVLANLKPWVVGLLARQLWSFAGSDRRSDVRPIIAAAVRELQLARWLVSEYVTDSDSQLDGQLGRKMDRAEICGFGSMIGISRQNSTSPI